MTTLHIQWICYLAQQLILHYSNHLTSEMPDMQEINGLLAQVDELHLIWFSPTIFKGKTKQSATWLQKKLTSHHINVFDTHKIKSLQFCKGVEFTKSA